MLQTTNHRIVQILLQEGANYYCNGGLINLAEILEKELNITKREAYEILLGCELCETSRYSIEFEIEKYDKGKD